LTGTVEDLVKYFAGKVPSYVKNPALRNSKVELSQTLKMVCAAITAARCAYAMRIAQTALAQVEDECSKLGIESGVQKGLVPADDSYLVIDNPFKSLAMGAKQICTSFDAYQVPNYSELAWGADKSALPSDLINAQNKKFAELVREARAAGINVVGTNDISLDEAEAGFNGVFRDDRQVRRGLATSILMKLFDVKVKANAGKGLKVAAKLIAEHNKNVSDFIGEWTGDTDRVAENEKLINPTQQKIGTALWAPFAITHFVGRTMVPYDTIKQLSPELQQALLDLAAFNTVNFYSFLV
jgi:ABC-type uncharacterized transport system auxiliary subunit